MRGRHISLGLPLVARTCGCSASRKKPKFAHEAKQRPVTSVCPRSPTRTVRLTFDLAAHTGAASFITWMLSVVIGACGGVMNSAREHEASRDRPRLSRLMLIGLGFLGGFLGGGWGAAQRSGGRSWWMVGDTPEGSVCVGSAAVWFELDKLTSMKNAELQTEFSSRCVWGENQPQHQQQQKQQLLQPYGWATLCQLAFSLKGAVKANKKTKKRLCASYARLHASILSLLTRNLDWDVSSLCFYSFRFFFSDESRESVGGGFV